MVHTPAQRRRLQKIDTMLDHALDIVQEHGLSGLTVARLAKRLDWTVGAMYRYFSSKDQLIAALNGRVIQGWTILLDARLREVEQAPALDRIRAALGLWIEVSLTRPAEFGLVALTLADPRNLVEDLEDAVHVPAMMGLLGRIVSLVDQAITEERMSPGDPLGRTLQLVFACQGVLQLRKLARFDPTAFDANALATRTVNDLLTAWEAP